MLRDGYVNSHDFLSNPYANYGVVDNSGVDGTITWNHKFGKDLRRL